MLLSGRPGISKVLEVQVEYFNLTSNPLLQHSLEVPLLSVYPWALGSPPPPQLPSAPLPPGASYYLHILLHTPLRLLSPTLLHPTLPQTRCAALASIASSSIVDRVLVVLCRTTLHRFFAATDLLLLPPFIIPVRTGWAYCSAVTRTPDIRVAAVVAFLSAGADADRCKRLSTFAGNLVSIGHSCLTGLERGGGIVL
ncbi:hypothetical protein HZ326_6432 [Fusarium oxysporum f. sp. albedinis]|nr:hypothetical protein HZ326_6432 [Fusarium oxysporum f. sp. albedinis]